jgi:GT2 family glycosyltransferase
MCNDTNVGFARGNNQGISKAQGTYIATLNNDARPDQHWLSTLVEAMSGDDCVGMVASQILFSHRSDLIDSAGIEVDALGMAWNRHLGMPVTQEPQEAIEVFGPCAGAALYRKAMLDQVGLFDERYFAYYEDVELAWRARRAGWRCVYAPQARVSHVHSATGQTGSAFKAYHINRNRVWTLIRHYPTSRLLLWWPLILSFDVATWLWPLLAGRTDALRGHLDALKEWSWAWGERRRLSDWRHPVPLVFPRLHMSGIPK